MNKSIIVRAYPDAADNSESPAPRTKMAVDATLEITATSYRLLPPRFRRKVRVRTRRV